MQIQHHVHATDLPRLLWPRCTKVEACNDLLHCEFAPDGQYDLIEAYSKTPHIQFMNCQSVDDLRSFTRAWGPLILYAHLGTRTSGLAKRFDG